MTRGPRPARPRGAGTITRVGFVAVAFVAALGGLGVLRSRLMPETPARSAREAPDGRAAVTETPAVAPVAAPTGDIVRAEEDAGVEPVVAPEILGLAGVDAGQLAERDGGVAATQVARSEARTLRSAAGAPSGLSDEEVAEIVRTHEPALAACYESELKQGRYRRGKMVLHFDITPRGQATRFAFEGDSLRSTKVRDCIVRRARDWRFPTFRGDPVRVAYPLSFRPA